MGAPAQRSYPELRPTLTASQYQPVTQTAGGHYAGMYLMCENDHGLPLALQRQKVERNAPHFKNELCMARHSPFLSQLTLLWTW